MNEGFNTEANKRIAKNTLYLYIRLVFVLIISLYSSRIILHNLGVVDYGIYNVVAGFVSMLTLLNASLSNASQRFYNYEKGRNGILGMQKVFISAHFIQFLFIIVIVVLAETIGLWYVSNKMVYPIERETAVFVVYQSSVVALVFVLLQIPYSSAIIAHERINYYAIVGVIDVCLKLVIALILPLIPCDRLSLYGILITGGAFVDYLLYFFYARKKFSYLRFKLLFYRDTFTSMLKFSGWCALNSFSQTVRNQGLNILINFFFGPIVNAARGISYQVKTALLGFVSNITTAAQPQVVESYAAGNIDRSRKLMFTISKLTFFSLYIVALPIIVEVGYVLRLWLGDDIPDYSEVFTSLVLIITMVDIMLTPIGMFVSASGKVGRYNFWNSVLGVCVLPVAYLFLKSGASPVSVFIVSLIFSIVMYFTSIIIISYETGVKVVHYLKDVLLPILFVVFSTVMFPLFIHYGLSSGFFRLIAVVAVVVISVTVSGYYLGLDRGEKELVISYIKRFLNKIGLGRKNV